VKPPNWLAKRTVIAIHEELLANFGGLAGVRDEALLDSALARPEHLFNYGKPTLFDLAASYAYGIISNHPLLDGNKRTGFTTAAVFLEDNEIRLTATEADAVAATLALASKTMTEPEYAAWLKANSSLAC
jgi:death-on-curing protein